MRSLIFVGMKRLDENRAATINALLYILSQLDRKGDFHKIFKILYFADRYHLSKYGVAISQDRYIAMANGPTPSMAYDIFKSLNQERFDPFFELDGRHTIIAKARPDMDYLSESEKECLDRSIKENKNISFQDLSDKSHDEAWRNAGKDGEMNIFDIARAGGANQEMIRYIEDCLENQLDVFE